MMRPPLTTGQRDLAGVQVYMHKPSLLSNHSSHIVDCDCVKQVPEHIVRKITKPANKKNRVGSVSNMLSVT